MKPGDLVIPVDPNSSPKLFLQSYYQWRSVIRPEAGKFEGVGIVIKLLDDDVLIFSSQATGWCCCKNVKVIS